MSNLVKADGAVKIHCRACKGTGNVPNYSDASPTRSCSAEFCEGGVVTVSEGFGVSLHGWSDVFPYTVIGVSKSGRKLTLQADSATLLNGFDSGEKDALKSYPGGFCAHVEGVQRYEIKPNPQGGITTANWSEKKGSFYSKSYRVSVGRAKHYDYNF